MITIKQNSLVIELRDSEPEQRREYLIQAIAAYMRHNAMALENNSAYKTDWQTMYTMAQLLEELIKLDAPIP